VACLARTRPFTAGAGLAPTACVTVTPDGLTSVICPCAASTLETDEAMSMPTVIAINSSFLNVHPRT
jgi:hypothetical protein